MFEQFSSGYYLGELYVQPRNGDAAAIRRADHERVNEQLYGDETELVRLDAPLVMKVGTRHFPVVGDDDLPSGTLALPRESIPDDLKFEVPGRKEVLLANAERTGELLEYAGWEPAEGADYA
jgi:hypothetical protein